MLMRSGYDTESEGTRQVYADPRGKRLASRLRTAAQILRAHLTIRGLMTALTVCLLASPVFAQVNPFEFEVYPYATLEAGNVELHSLNSFVPKGHHEGPNGTSDGLYPSDSMFRTTLELSYGLTDKVETGAYLNLVHPNADSFQYAGSLYRLEGSLFEAGEMPVDIGWYVELEWWRTPQIAKDQVALDLRPIIQKNLGRLSVILNPIFDKALAGHGKNQGFEFGYANKIAWQLTSHLSTGLEFYGGAGLIDDTDPLYAQQHYIFPVVDVELPGGIGANIGAGFGLTRGSDRVITKVNLEFERFVGKLL